MNDWDPEPRIKEWAANSGKGKEMAYAESYRVITLVSDEDWEKSKGDPFKLVAADESATAKSAGD